MYINTNTTSLNAQRNLANSTKAINNAMEKLSSGKRINSASDDAAGLAISNRHTSIIKTLDTIDKNINDGISYAQVADGALEEVGAMVQRMYQLSIQATSGALNKSDRRSLDIEFQELKEEINRVAYSTHIFDHYPLLPSAIPTTVVNSIDNVVSNGIQQSFASGIQSFASIPAGSTNVTIEIDALGADDDIQLFTQSGQHIVGTDLNDYVWNSKGISTPADVENSVLTVANGYSPTATYDDSSLNSGGAAYSATASNTTNYNGMNISFGGDADRTSPSDGNNNGSVTQRIETLHIDQTTEPLMLSVVGNGSFYITATWTGLGPANPEQKNDDGEFQVFVATQADGVDDVIQIDKTPSTAGDLNIAGLSLDPLSEAQKAIVSMKNAIDKVGENRAHYGAKMGGLDSVARSSRNSHMNLSAARSRVMDADFAIQTALMTKQSILKQGAETVLSKANIKPELALKLLTF
ncbi:flagellin [Thalassotalea sp. SU-HH00458]|uniref:flagellin N-terminal helical domain-containing protein n=1 Tax=Thalassotalea sp. SU-HH00458 TaxID=3127657 RepID=UPI0031080E48